MTDPKTPQQTSDSNYPYPLEEETSFIDILSVIIKKKGLIFLITSIFLILSFCYYTFATPMYRAKISFLPPAQETYLSSIDTNIFTKPIDTNPNDKNDSNKTLESFPNIWSNLNTDKFLYRQFLTRIQSFSQQKEVLLNKSILENFFGKTPDLKNLDQKFIDLHKKISLKMDGAKKNTKDAFILDKPADLEMEGSNPVAMAEFLNLLSESTKSEIIKETQYSLQKLINNRLKIALNHKELLRFKASKNRQKKIKVFSDSLKIAQKLNVKKNNFHILKNHLNFELGKNEARNEEAQKNYEKGQIPIWFLFGEVALSEEIKILNSRTIDDSYIEELVDLEAQIKQLQSFDAKTLTPNVILIEQPSIPPTISINLVAIKVFPIGIGLGLLFGIIAAFLSHSMELLRNKNSIN